MPRYYCRSLYAMPLLRIIYFDYFLRRCFSSLMLRFSSPSFRLRFPPPPPLLMIIAIIFFHFRRLFSLSFDYFRDALLRLLLPADIADISSMPCCCYAACFRRQLFAFIIIFFHFSDADY